MVRDKRSRAWTLSKKSQHSIDAPAGRRFVHVQFNTSGSDLTVIDDSGLVHIYASQDVLGRVQLMSIDPSFDEESHTGLSAIVGLQWLPTLADLRV
jgi:hypothetical protein